MSELARLLSQYGEGYSPEEGAGGPTTSNMLAQYRPPGKGERMQRAWNDLMERIDADMVRKARAPWWGETQQRELPWPLSKITDATVPFPAKDSKLADLGRTALFASMWPYAGMGPSNGFGRAIHGDSEPMAYHVPGGLGLFDAQPFPAGGSGFATQPREIAGGVVAPLLSATKHDTSPMSDTATADKAWEKARLEYPLRDQIARIANDFRERPAHHAWNSARQIPMMMGYTGASEGAAALGLLRYLPLLARAEEAPIPGSILDRPAYSRFARPTER